MKNLMLLLSITGMSVYLHAQEASTTTPSSSSIHSSKTTSMEPLQVVHDFLTAVQNGDHAKVNALVDTSIQWEQPGSNRFSGTKTSLKTVYEMIGGMSALTDHTLKLTSVKILAVNSNKVAAVINWKATKPSGDALDVDNVDVYTIENGKITKATVFSADIETENRYWGK